MAYGALTDKNLKPDDESVHNCLASAEVYWNSLVQNITDNYKAGGEWKYYGKNYGWALGFKKSGKALISLFPAKDYFTALIILNSKQAENSLKEGLNPNTLKLIEKTPRIYEGRWIFLPVKCEEDIADIRILLKIRTLKI